MTSLTRLRAASAAFVLIAFSVFSTLSPASSAAESPQQVSEQTAPLDINAADATAIAQALDGVGMVKAQEIVAYREMFGKFRSVDELAEVQGIGAATVEKNRHRIVIVNN